MPSAMRSERHKEEEVNEGDEVLEFVYGIKDGSKIEIQQ